MREVADTESGGDAPYTVEVARALEFDANQLRLFEESHPNPSVPAVLAAADAKDADAETRQLVERWLRSRAEIDRSVSLPWGGGE